jgi:hypothetical protein
MAPWLVTVKALLARSVTGPPADRGGCLDVLLLIGPAAQRPPYRLASGRLRAGDRAAAGADIAPVQDSGSGQNSSATSMTTWCWFRAA